jgi:hypothetical protein
MNPNSLLYWYPKIAELPINTPKTKWVEVPNLYSILDGKRLSASLVHQIVETAQSIRYPLFLRTDLVSNKHDWLETCYVEKLEDLFQHIFNIVEFNAMISMCDADPVALVFREYIPLEATFTAFNGMPVAKERRYFISEGQTLCHHPYWIEGAIAEHFRQPSVPDWREKLAKLNHESLAEKKLLTTLADEVGSVMPGYWSVDFALAQDGRWLLIDMAEGERSWHPDCPNKRSLLAEGA